MTRNACMDRVWVLYGRCMARVLVGITGLMLALPGPGAAQGFNWDALGTEFCRATLTGNLNEIAPLLSDRLTADIRSKLGSPDMPPARVLFQTYLNEVETCQASTRNAALVEIKRAAFGVGGPAWSDYLVIVPEKDGTMRVDDVLFATRRSDTLRARLEAYD